MLLELMVVQILKIIINKVIIVKKHRMDLKNLSKNKVQMDLINNILIEV